MGSGNSFIEQGSQMARAQGNSFPVRPPGFLCISVCPLGSCAAACRAPRPSCSSLQRCVILVSPFRQLIIIIILLAAAACRLLLLRLLRLLVLGWL
jgi:hypothetical protein